MIKIQGIQRSVEKVTVEVDNHEVFKAAFSLLDSDQVGQLVYARAIEICVHNSDDLNRLDLPTLYTDLDGQMSWMCYDGHDAQRGGALYRTLRKLTKEESELMSLAEQVEQKLKIKERE